jgi:hypothetical protein
VKVTRRFGETYRLHFKDENVRQARNQQSSTFRLLDAALFLGLLLDPEDGDDMFF